MMRHADRGQATPLIDRIIETIEHRCGLTRVRFEKTQAASASRGFSNWLRIRRAFRSLRALIAVAYGRTSADVANPARRIDSAIAKGCFGRGRYEGRNQAV